MATVSVRDGFHVETRKLSQLTSAVAGVKDGWRRGEPLDTSGTQAVDEVYAELSTLIATFGELVSHDVDEFGKFGVSIEVRDREDAKQK